PAIQARLYDKGSPGIGTPVPEIQGKDVDGRPLDLARYRGKVVVLLFWGDWNGPSRAMYPTARALVARMDGKPFALLGINSDTDRNALLRRLEQEKLPWQSWFDGGREGPIASRFKIPGWPTIYLVDHRGVVRHKSLGLPEDDVFGAILDELIERASRDATAGTPAGE
ncbi:MAG: TlpA family protein disulfide reductase, partial [Isosphaeraceae bacterium]